MRPRKWVRTLGLGLVVTLVLGVSAPGYSGGGITQGSTGPEVEDVQVALVRLGYYEGMVDGQFGTASMKALQAFQKDWGLEPDGVAGKETLYWLNLAQSQGERRYQVRENDTLDLIAQRFNVSSRDILNANPAVDPANIQVGQFLVIPGQLASRGGGRKHPELIAWREVNRMWPDHGMVKIIDVETRRSFNVRRRGGHYHADIEPATLEDTQTIKDIYHGWKWDRRAVIVEINGRFIAASINGFPHGGEYLHSNGMNGHICAHFLGSKIHRTGRPDKAHQDMVMFSVRAEL